MAEGVSETEEAILDATLAEVLVHGIRRTTASDIARRAGVARQTLYRYWPDVQSLLAALVTRELLAVLPAEADDPPDLHGVVELFATTADRVRHMPLVDRLRATAPELLSRYVLERLGQSQRVVHADAARRISSAQKTGTVREGDPERLAAMVLLITQSAVLSAPLVLPWLPDDAWRAELAQALHGYLQPATS